MLKALPFHRITSEGYSFQVEILFHCARDRWQLVMRVAAGWPGSKRARTTRGEALG